MKSYRSSSVVYTYAMSVAENVYVNACLSPEVLYRG
jgi:hypothetical protein